MEHLKAVICSNPNNFYNWDNFCYYEATVLYTFHSMNAHLNPQEIKPIIAKAFQVGVKIIITCFDFGSELLY